MVCGVNQICYTNIDDETDFVSRGCVNTVVFNSMYYFCNNSMCNNVKFLNPKLRISQEEIQVKGNPSYLRKALKMDELSLKPKVRSGSILHYKDFSLNTFIILVYYYII